MSAMSHEFDLSQAKVLPPVVGGVDDASELAALAERWDAVHDAAGAVAALAGIVPERLSAEIAQLPARAAEAGGWTFEMAVRGVDDIAAMLQPGLKALIVLSAEGRDTRTAALTLWNEFDRARVALRVLVAQA